MTLDDYRWLISDSAAPWLAVAAAETESVRLLARLRQHLTAAQAGLALEQAELRRRAAAKFAQAAQMFFERQALEQASDELVAGYKALRYAPGSAVIDYCCGIGGDLLSLAGRGPTVGVERNPTTALLAEANLRAVGRAAGDAADSGTLGALTLPARHAVAVEAVGPGRLAQADAWHIDPDRRPHGRRTTRVELHEPGPEMIDSLLAVQPAGAVKLAPAAELPAHWPPQAELEWISRRGECRQLVAWFGPLAQLAGRRRATIVRGAIPQTHGEHSVGLDGGTMVLRTIVGPAPGAPEPEVPVASKIGGYLFEPDAAVLAAGVRGTLAAEHGLMAVEPQSAYWTGERAVADVALSVFAVDDVMAYDARRVKAYMRERGIGRLEVKQRGTGLDPAAVQKQLRAAGEASATLLLTRIGGQVTAAIARRVKWAD